MGYIWIRENVYLHDLYVFNEAGQQVETGWVGDENQPTWPNYIQWIKLEQNHAKWLENETINSIIDFGMPIVT